MPAKRRLGKQRGIVGIDDARILFRLSRGFATTPSGAGIFTDEALAEAYGSLPLIAYPHPHEILDTLRSEKDVA